MRWIEPEARARADLKEHLAEYTGLARATHNLVEAGIATAMRGRTSPPPHAAEVQARLLVRLSNDLRVVELAAKNSYVLQALSLAATIYELSHAVAYMGASDGRAKRWEQHEDSQRSYPPPRERREAVRTTLLAIVPDLANIEARIDEQEELYSVFCMAKHGNPRVLRRFGVAVLGDRVQLYHGPFIAPYVTRQARFVLLHSARMVAAATMVFAAPLTKGAPLGVGKRYRRLERAVSQQLLSFMDRRVNGE